MTENLIKIAKRWKPRGTFIKFRKDHYLTPAHATTDEDGRKVMYVPKIVSREALFIFLHEAAHHHLGHCKPSYSAPMWQMEYEAEKWAIKTMRAEGLRVPRSMIAEAKRYVTECAKTCSEPPSTEVRLWMTRRFKKRPKPIANYRKKKVK